MPRGTCRQRAKEVRYQTKKVEPTGILALVDRLLCRVRSSGIAPLAWHHSSGAPLHRSNKPGLKGRRVVHVLPSMGKQFFKVLMRSKKPNGGGWSQPENADWLQMATFRGGDGSRRFSSDRSQVTTWRLERLGLKSITAFHDLTKAFGSVKWEAKDRAVAFVLGPNALIGQEGCRLAITTIPGRDGDIALKIGEGGLTGGPADGGSVLGDVSTFADLLAAVGGGRIFGASVVGSTAVCQRHE